MAQPLIIAKFYKVRIFQPGFGPRIVSALMADLQAGDLSTQNIICPPAAGAPGSKTLLAGFTSYLPGDLYFDSQGLQAYTCIKAGTNANSTWQPTGGAGSSGFKYFITPQNVNGSPPANTYGEISFQAADGTTIYKNPGSEFIASEIISTQTNALVTYSNYDTVYYNYRTASTGGTSEVQYITPQYQAGQVILAAFISNSVTGAGGQLQSVLNGVGPNVWMEIFPVRVWSGLNPPNNQNS